MAKVTLTSFLAACKANDDYLYKRAIINHHVFEADGISLEYGESIIYVDEETAEHFPDSKYIKARPKSGAW